MSDAVVFRLRHLLDVAFPKKIFLGLCFELLADVYVAMPIRTRHDLCFLQLVIFSRAKFTSLV